MQTKQKFDIVDQDTLAYCIQDYENRGEYSTPTMNKTDPGASLEKLHPFCEETVGAKLEYVSGNFYKHSVPYLPHTDFKTYQNNTINFVVPLQYIGTQPYLVVFDQVWEQDSVTWCMHHKVQYFEYNIGVKGCPRDYPIKNATGKPVDDALYAYLTHYPRIMLDSLSGSAYPFEPGSVISFDNKQIHCTSNFQGEKLGISLRFRLA